ncbi:SDR family NAD(P)-dependent oxidoreductase [Pseudomaricurvus alkylphenolicus]|jgi:NAD(P)-dependent dehydrogenase (short-subunit alcohol dehydrogenase family)|uniref:oxidoreductase n=1 Tax=Pseudomaricurvus alkylphenolicus TaxID=1306991 RepID=UPI00141F0280|nr:oxidoreductase [Pseudomaricurvus alkylphenolicus]NIB38086.1 SDR family NAD(P)-dependent oxidoreductase [Pseudomaricurvus alkylphenolicus]
MSKGFTDQDVPPQAGKVALITGANTGLGFEVARVLAAKGAEVLIACRSESKAMNAIDQIQRESPGAKLHFQPLDLSNLASIREAAVHLAALPRLDLLINNAGIMIPPYELTADGFESQFGVNHLGPFALTGLLLGKLNRTPGARVVNTSSLAGRDGRILFEDINAKTGYEAMERYRMSKLANLLYSLELNRRLKATGSHCISVACHPGIADTELSRHMPGWFTLLTPLVRALFNTPAQGAWPTLQAATDLTLKGGEYCGPSRRKQTSGPARVVPSGRHSLTTLRKLWDLSVKMTGVDYL